MLGKYLHLIQLAFQEEDFGDEEIEEFQDLIDEWFFQYVEMFGLPWAMNYMHLLGAGHLYHYLKTWGNLYRYQQQGWEMKNGNIAAFMNRRTQKRGAGEKYGLAHTSRVMPLMQWLQCTTAWVTLDAMIFFMKMEEEGERHQVENAN